MRVIGETQPSCRTAAGAPLHVYQHPLRGGPWKLPLEQRTVAIPLGFGHSPDEPPNAGLAPNSTARPLPPLITHGDEG